MENINVKNAVDVLKDRVNKIVGSNKSKAKLSIVDKIKQKYYSAWLDYAAVKIEDLKNENKDIKVGMEIINDKITESIDTASVNDIKKLDKEYASDKKELENNNQKIEDLKIIAQEAQEKLDEIDAKVEQQEAVEVEQETVTPIVDESHKEATETAVEEKLKETEEVLKNNVESMNMEEAKTNPIEKMLVEYREKTDDLLAKYNNENSAIFSKYVSEKEAINLFNIKS